MDKDGCDTLYGSDEWNKRRKERLAVATSKKTITIKLEIDMIVYGNELKHCNSECRFSHDGYCILFDDELPSPWSQKYQCFANLRLQPCKDLCERALNEQA